MLGHAIWLRLKDVHDTAGSVRGGIEELSGKCSLFNKYDKNIIDGVNVLDDNDLKRALDIAKPHVAINCVGVIKQLQEAKLPIPSISLNALFPHKLLKMCEERNIQLIHISTDCVFSGNKGNYVESDIPDAIDLYGRTKHLGEATGNNCLTIRTSLVGRQLSGTTGLFEWFFASKGTVHGYRKTIFSGLTTYAMAEIIEILIEKHSAVRGLYNVSSEPINKYDLLIRFKEALNLDIEVIPDDYVVKDMSLDSTKFRKLTDIYIPTWDEMIEDLVKRVGNYEKWRGSKIEQECQR